MLTKNVLFSTICLIVLQLSVNTIFAQPDLEWEKNYGGPSSEIARSLEQTADGGYIATGMSESNSGDVGGNNGFGDFWLIKLDAFGNQEWEKNYGGSQFDVPNDVQQTTDGGYVVAGVTISFSGDGDIGENNGLADFWLIKLDGFGNLEWEKTYGGSSDETAESIKQTTDGGYILAGKTESDDGDVGGNNGDYDFWIIKLDTWGELEWEKTYGGANFDSAATVEQTPDGGYVVSGGTDSFDGDVSENKGLNDFWVIKLDALGNMEWEKTYGGSNRDFAHSLQQTNDGGYIIGGSSNSNDGDVGGNNGGRDFWIIKLDTSGELVWERNYGGSSEETILSVGLTNDGGYIVGGRAESNDGDVGENYGDTDAWVIKLNEMGELEWGKNYGGSDVDVFNSVHQSTDGGYIFTGGSRSIDGDVSENNGSFDFWVVKLASTLVGIQKMNADFKFSLSPNPSFGSFTLKLGSQNNPVNVKIFDLLGRTVYEKAEVPQALEINGIPKGQYCIQITLGSASYTRKLLVH